MKQHGSPLRTLLIVLGVISLGMNCLVFLFLIGMGAVFVSGTGHQPAHEKVLEGEGKDKIAWIQLSGIVMEGVSSGFSPVRGLVDEGRRQLKLAKQDEHVKAVVLVINSPGGTITGADILFHELKKFRQEKDVPMIAFFQDVAASGGYYIAMASDEIIALPTGITGSIGAIIHYTNYQGLYEWLRLSDVTIKSGELKDMGSPTKKMSEKEREIFQSLIDHVFDRFLEVVLEGRGMDMETLKPLADGRVFNTTQALHANLIDAIGYREDVIKRAKELAGLTEASVVTYPHRFSWFDFLSARTGHARGRESTLEDLVRRFPAPGIYYLWQGAFHSM